MVGNIRVNADVMSELVTLKSEDARICPMTSESDLLAHVLYEDKLSNSNNRYLLIFLPLDHVKINILSSVPNASDNVG